MATSRKLPNVKDLSGYFFMSIQGNTVNTIYHDATENGLALGTALTGVLQEDIKLFDIFSAAMLTAIEEKNEKYNSKKSNKLPKKPVKTAK